MVRFIIERIWTLDFTTLWGALKQRPFFETVSHVEVTATPGEGNRMVT